MRWPKLGAKPLFRVGIRTQFTTLVCLVAMASLVILSVSTGIYFTSNYKNLRSQRLYIAARLRASQLDQTLNFLYYQCYYLTSQDTLGDFLIGYISGNSSTESLGKSQQLVEKFLSSSNIFFAAQVYDTSFNVVLNATNNGTGDQIPEHVRRHLFPLASNTSLPSSLSTIGFLTDPVSNGTDYLMSMSLPVVANPRITVTDSRVYGYITILMSAGSIKSICNDTTALEKSEVAVISGIYNNIDELSSFHLILPPRGSEPNITHVKYQIKNNTFVSSGFSTGVGGSVKKTKFLYSTNVAVGYAVCSIKLTNWIAIISQPESVFLSPATKLTKIIAGTAVGIAVVVCLGTFPLAHWAVKPIIRLQKATELISEGRGLRTASYPRSSTSSSMNNTYRWSKDLSNGVNNDLIASGNKEKTEMSTDDDKDSAETEETTIFTAAVRHLPLFSFPTIDQETSSVASQKYTSTNLMDMRVPVYSRLFQDELSELTDTFNAMTDALDQHYALLEERVRARTKQLEAAKIEAESANEAKTVFIANISHELRTPLNGILGMTAISMEEDELDVIQNNLKLIFRSGELLLHILTELLTFSKNTLQKTKLEKRDFLITDIAMQIKSIFGKIARDQGVKFSIILTPNIIRSMVLWGDSNRIIQVVMNLVSNALKFTPVDGRVSVRVKLIGEYDEDSSKLRQFHEVCVKTGTEVDDLLDAQIGKTPLEIEDPSYNPGIREIEEEGSILTSEASSIESTTTSSYDDNLFNNQFNKDSALEGEIDGKHSEPLANPNYWVVQFEVEDTGPGIAPELQESVFKPFVQGDQTLSRQYGGTGLGLSICRQLAGMMKGTMKLKSQVGVGTKFTFTVPLKQTKRIIFTDPKEDFEDEFNIYSKKNRRVKFKSDRSLMSLHSRSTSGSPIKSPSKSKKEPEDASEKLLHRPLLQSTGTATSRKDLHIVETPFVEKDYKILITEDNHINQEVIKRMLSLEGCKNIDIACDGQEAFDKVKQLLECNTYYDLIFMDIQMPRMDGLEATRLIRNELDYKHPIVALTAFADTSNIKECFESGMDGFLSKPIKRPKLKTILQEFGVKSQTTTS